MDPILPPDTEPETPKERGHGVTVFLVIICSVITGLAVNFYDNLHYSNAETQLSGQLATSQSKVGKDQDDLTFLITNDTKQINCYDLRSTFARNLCNTHDSSTD